MTNAEIARLRLGNQRIVGPPLADPGAVVRRLGAMQAQDYAQATWAIGRRARGATLADVERAIGERTILRTWPMRGTIHFVPPEDAKWMLQLSASRVIARDARRQGQLGLDEAIMGRCAALLADALTGGKRLSRAGMMGVLEGAGIGTEKQRGYHILWYTAQTGLICLGPLQGKEQTFVLLDEWVPHSRELSREEALAELARRYFASHGPATVHDFAWWAGITITEARAGLAANSPAFVAVKYGGADYWVDAEGAGALAPEESSVQLLPGFDEYLLGYKDRSAVLAAEHAPKIVPGGNGVFFPMIVVNGEVVGTWKRAVKKGALAVTLTPFAPLGDLEERAVEEAGAYAAFVGLPLASVTIDA